MCLSATKCKPTPTTPTTTHPTLIHTISLTRAHSTSAACAAETQDNEERRNAYRTEPPAGVTTVSPHTHTLHCADPRYGLLGPTPPAKAFIRPHRPHSLTPAATAAAKQAEAAAHHNPTITGHSQHNKTFHLKRCRYCSLISHVSPLCIRRSNGGSRQRT